LKAETDSRILVLGAGPAGISAAYELSRQGYGSTILESTPHVGGLSKTLQFGDFRTDIGPHRFFSKNQFLYDMIGEVLKEDWILVNRFTRFFIRGKFYMYPVDMWDALRNLGLSGSAAALLDYVRSKLRKVFLNPPVNNFEDYAVLEFGRTLAELNMINYTEKIWGIPCSRISAEWATQRIKGLSILSILQNAILKNRKGPKTLVDQFYYPRLGAGQTYETMAGLITERGGRVRLSAPVKGVGHDQGKITSITVMTEDGREEVLPADYVISSIPITEFVKAMSPAPPESVLSACSRLRWRGQVYLYLQLKKERVSRDNWVYFPDREIPFGRMHEAKNFSESLSPKDRTSLWVEHFVFPEDPRWESPAADLRDVTLPDLSRLGFVQEEEIEDFRKHREEFVYPVYEIGYKENLDTVKDYLAAFSNLQLVGRPGRFRYNNQDHSIETGVLAARNLARGESYDLEKVGSEQEYFEKGHVRPGKDNA
jgi:protoporphyrinogen oxidase